VEVAPRPAATAPSLRQRPFFLSLIRHSRTHPPPPPTPSSPLLTQKKQSKQRAKAPFSEYAALEAAGVKVIWGNPADPAAIPAGPFDAVYDNNGKDVEACQPLIDAFKGPGKVKHYVFVSSAGAYTPSPIEPGHWEGDARKATAGHVGVEAALKEANLPFTVFQPLYIYGPATAKDCEQWFLDRIMRGRPVPIPAPGVQLVTLSHVEDLAAALAAVPGNPAAVGQHLNLCADRAITHTGVVAALAKAAGVEAKVVLYDPAAVDAKKSGYPFRPGHFFANADKAKRVLGWTPAHTFGGDAPALVAAYKASGRDKKDIDFSADDAILAAVGEKVAVAA
jgi:nucleoside-diphosphate-sugar epimerase